MQKEKRLTEIENMQLWLHLPAFLGSWVPQHLIWICTSWKVTYTRALSFQLLQHLLLVWVTNKIGKELPILTPVFFYIFDRHMSLMMTPLSEVRQRECDLQFDLLYQSVWNVCQAFILATEVAIRWERKLGRGSQVPLPTCCWKWVHISWKKLTTHWYIRGRANVTVVVVYFFSSRCTLDD